MACGSQSMVSRFEYILENSPEQADAFIQSLNDTFETVYPGKQDAGFAFDGLREDDTGVYAIYTDGENTQELTFMSKGCGSCNGCG